MVGKFLKWANSIVFTSEINKLVNCKEILLFETIGLYWTLGGVKFLLVTELSLIRENALAREKDINIFLLPIMVLILMRSVNIYELNRLFQIIFKSAQVIDLVIKLLLTKLQNICFHDDNDVQCLKKYICMCMFDDFLRIYNIINYHILMVIFFYNSILPIIDHG